MEGEWLVVFLWSEGEGIFWKIGIARQLSEKFDRLEEISLAKVQSNHHIMRNIARMIVYI